jgi:hypothetical protein
MSKQKNTNYTDKLIILALILVLIIILVSKCESCVKGGDTNKPTTDTVYIPGEKTIERVPVLALENGRIPDPAKVIVDSFVAYEKILTSVDSNEIIRPWIEKYNDIADNYNKLLTDYNAERQYVDSARFKAALVTVKNKVQKNRIFGQQIFLDSTLFVTTTVPEKRRNKLFFDMGGQWLSDTTMSLMAGLSLLTKKNKIYSLDGLIDTRGRYGVQGKISLPLSLRRK